MSNQTLFFLDEKPATSAVVFVACLSGLATSSLNLSLWVQWGQICLRVRFGTPPSAGGGSSLLLFTAGLIVGLIVAQTSL